MASKTIISSSCATRKDTHYGEDVLLPISALQHFLFCERQCALIHLERLWVENVLTLQGRQLHERVDTPGHERRGGRYDVRGLSLRSFSLGVYGRGDLVEFHEVSSGYPSPVCRKDSLIQWDVLPEGCYRCVPVEFKRGRPKREPCDLVQLCAQAFCLEEMFSTVVETGYIYYEQTGRRLQVDIDQDLRRKTTEACLRLHALIASKQTPRAMYSSKCDSCSLISVCMPKAMSLAKNPHDYLREACEGL